MVLLIFYLLYYSFTLPSVRRITDKNDSPYLIQVFSINL